MTLSMKIALLAALAVVAVWLAQLWQQRDLAVIVNTIELSAKSGKSKVEGIQGIGEVPPPVARYLNHVLSTNKRRLLVARYRQVGTLRTDTQSERWMNFTASQVIAPARSEFVWDARVSVIRLLHLRIRDSFVGGRGAGQVVLRSAVPVGSAGGTLEMNSGSLHRFLAEAVWYPTALLPSSFLTWEPIDDARALATLTHGHISVSLEFRFNHHNEVVAIYPRTLGLI